MLFALGKARDLRIQRWQGCAADDYGFTPAALALKRSRFRSIRVWDHLANWKPWEFFWYALINPTVPRKPLFGQDLVHCDHFQTSQIIAGDDTCKVVGYHRLNPKLSVSNFSDNQVCSFYWIFPRLILKNVKPVGIADLTASTASDAFPHSSL